MPALISLASKILSLLVVLSGSVRFDSPLYVGGTDYLFQYDDGTAYWLTWNGVFRGTWYDLNDFGFSGSWYNVQSQLWFYHHASYPWDTASFYCELYSGDESGPVSQLNQTSVTAAHYSPVYASYNPAIFCPDNFWILVNTELSAGGWPALLSDDSPNWTGSAHSFYSDDFIEWIPWVPVSTGISRMTWGAVKSIHGTGAFTATESCDYFIRSSWLQASTGPLEHSQTHLQPDG